MKRPPDPARTTEPGALQLIEEAVHLLRRAPPATLAIYLVGAVPWTLGFLFFWGHTTWFAPTAETLAWSALMLVGLFTWLKATQAEFCRRLLAQRQGEAVPAWSWRRIAEVAAAQVAIQAHGLALLPVAMLLTFPFGWVYAFYQNATVLGLGADGRSLGSLAREHTMRWPAQNHMGLLYLSLLTLAVAVNFATSFYVLPWLANRVLGIENLFGFGGWWWLNTTFLASIAALTWVTIDPLVKAFYVLRVFYVRAQQSGEDLRVDLTLARQRRRALAGAVGLLAVSLFALFPATLQAAASAPANAEAARASAVSPLAKQTVHPGALERAIERVLQRRDFQWQLRPRKDAAAGARKEGPVIRFLRQGVEFCKAMVDTVRDAWRKLNDWFDRLFPSKKKTPQASAATSGGAVDWLRVFLYVAIAGAAVLIGFVIFLIWKQARRQAAPTLTARAVSVAQPDLRDERVEASQMPADGWLALAREQMAKGERRLALRALYLATLARLAADGLVSLAKFKTNLDYERELRRRALARPDVVRSFTRRRDDFEAVWYGRAETDEERLRSWLGELEGSAPSP
jgi:hypothetical protein